MGVDDGAELDRIRQEIDELRVEARALADAVDANASLFGSQLDRIEGAVTASPASRDVAMARMTEAIAAVRADIARLHQARQQDAAGAAASIARLEAALAAVAERLDQPPRPGRRWSRLRRD